MQNVNRYSRRAPNIISFDATDAISVARHSGQPHESGPVKITRLKTAVVEGNFDWTFVRIETDESITGLGECFFAPGLTAILRSLEPLLLGEDPRDINRLFRKLQMATSGAGSVAGIVYNAISGIDAALWDILGKSLNAPIYRLLGGKFRDKVRIYADCHGGEALESLDEILRSRGASWDPKGSS